MSERTLQQAAAELGIECRANEPLGPHTTMGVGGPAPFLLLPRDASSLAAIVAELAASGTRYRILGAGSNVIVADEGVSTPVISCARLAATIEREQDSVRAGAGVLVPRLVREMAGMGLSGLEFAEGIPGSVGGCVRMNAGAGGRWIGDVVREVDVVTPHGELQRRTPGPGDFGYRRSFVAVEGLIAVGALFEGRAEDPATIRERMRESRDYRLATQPLSERSSGCIFKNPEGGSAGEVLDRLGMKGMSVGGAVLSDVHANFIVNRGGTASDVLALAERVKREALDRAGVALSFEVELWRDAR